MTVVLDAVLGSPSANSYIDVATADGLMPLIAPTSRVTTWSGKGEDVKAVLLIRATKMLETYMDFDGIRMDSYQPLAWPRDWVYGPDRSYPFDSTELPPAVQEATSLMALGLAEGFDQSTASASPIERLQVSTLKIQFDLSRGARAAILIPSEVIEKLRGYGEYKGTSGLARSIPLVRG